MQEFVVQNLISIAFIILFIFGFVKGFSEGFLKKILSFGSLIVTIIVTKIFTPILAGFLKDITNIEPSLSDFIFKALIESTNYDKIKLGGLEKILGTQNIVESIKNSLCVNIANIIINLICGIVVFIVTLILVKILLKVLDIVDYIPVFGQFNKILGGVLGVFEIVIFAWIAFTILRVLSGIPEVSTIVESVEKSAIGRLIYDNNLIFNFMSNLFTLFKKK